MVSPLGSAKFSNPFLILGTLLDVVPGKTLFERLQPHLCLPHIFFSEASPELATPPNSLSAA